MKKTKLLTPFLLLGTAFTCTGCKGITEPLHKLTDYVYELDTYTELDYDYADKFWAESNDNWGGGCSAVTKNIEINGQTHRIIGRNMDLNISNKCAYIVRTNAGKHKTVGLTYTFRDYSPDYADVEEDGISKKFYKILPFLCDDVMNDAGLHIEVNMRHGEFYPNGEDMFALEHAFPEDYKGKRRIHMFELPRYIGENCSTIAEAKEYIKTLDIYSKHEYWNYCFILGDATGAGALVEFNEIGLAEMFNIDAERVTWFDDNQETLDYLSSYMCTGPTGKETPIKVNAIAQTNFYVNKYAYMFEDTKSGEGRFITLQNGINEVKTKSDMYDLMRKIQYSSFYLPYEECDANHFDPRTENVGELGGATYNMLFNEKNQEYVKYYFDEYTKPIRELTRQQKQDENKYWESTFTEVADCMTRTISVRMFENENIRFNVGLDSTTEFNLD